MFEVTKETGAFHNIYKTGIGAEPERRILHEGNESGEGTMRRFEIAPGIQITYNDLKMDSCFRPIRFEKDFLQINHCLEGCYECELDGGAVSFLRYGRVLPPARPAVCRRAPGGARGQGGDLRKSDGRPHFRPG